MKKIFILLMLVVQLFANAVTIPLLSVNNDEDKVTIKLPNVDIGLSGVIVHNINANHRVILKNAEVISYDKVTQIATLKLFPFEEFKNKALPKSRFKVSKKDSVILALNYKRAMLIAPTEAIYSKITRNVKLDWVDSDYFAVLLSTHGHPTPLIEDFRAMRENYAVGLFIIYLDGKLYTLDAQSFKVLSMSDAPFDSEAKKGVKLPFYSDVKEIEANWFGAGSEKLKAYAPYYKKLLKEYNPNKIK